MHKSMGTIQAASPAGMYPDAVPSLGFAWELAQNVEFTSGMVRASGDRSLALSNTEAFPVRGLGALRTNAGVQELYFGTLSTLYRSVALSPAAAVGTGFSAEAQETSTHPAGHWAFVPWGEWMLASNGTDPVQVRKGTGNFAPLLEGGTGALPFTRARLLARSGPHVLAANFNNGPSEIRWCSADDIESWYPATTNTAGEYTIRDTDSELIAWKPLGDRLAVYTRDAMYTISYIGAPFVFSVLPALNGIGAWGQESVASVGRENYGWGPSGFFQTDGTQFQYIADASIKNWVSTRAWEAQASKIVAFNNEKKHRVEWYYPVNDLSECLEGVAFDYVTKAWIFLSTGYSAVLERDVFQYPLGAEAGSNIYAMNSGSYVQSAELMSRPLDFGASSRGKFLAELRALYTGSVFVRIGFHENLTDTPTWLPLTALTGDWDLVEILRTAKYFRVNFLGTGPWALTAFEFFGRGGGLQK